MGQTESPAKPRRFFNIQALGKKMGIEVQKPVATAPTVDINAPHLEVKTSSMDINRDAAPAPVVTRFTEGVVTAQPSPAASTEAASQNGIPAVYKEAFKDAPANALDPAASVSAVDAPVPTVSIPATKDHHEASFLNPNPVQAQEGASPSASPVTVESAAVQPPAPAEQNLADISKPAAVVVDAQVVASAASEATPVLPVVPEVVPVEHEEDVAVSAPVSEPVSTIVVPQGAVASEVGEVEEAPVNKPATVPDAFEKSFADAPEDALDPTKQAKEAIQPKKEAAENPLAERLLSEDPDRYIKIMDNGDLVLDTEELDAAIFAAEVQARPSVKFLIEKLKDRGVTREEILEKILKPIIEKLDKVAA